MKPLHQLPIFAAAMLTLAGTVHAQTPEAPKSAPAPVTPPAMFPPEDLQEMTTYLHLGPGNMASAVKLLEENYFERFTKTAEERYAMPKLIYGPEAENAPIYAELKLSLYNTPALDAVALVAAAAGCRLEPIPALPDSPEDKKKPQRVIGYYVTIAMRNPTAQAPGSKPVFRDVSLNTAGTIGLTLAEQNGDILIRDVLPGLPAAQSKAIAPGEKLLSIAEEGSTEVRAAEVGPEKVTQMLIGEPGTKVRVTVAPPHGEGHPKAVLLTRQHPQGTIATPPPPMVRVVEPVVDTFYFANVDAKPNPGIPGQPTHAPALQGTVNDVALAPPAIPGMPGASSPTPSGPLVRIYPVAFFLKGSEDEVAKQQAGLEQLVQEALLHAKLDEKDSPTLSLHGGTKVLIVKATATQHEIIQQVITALKENEQSGAKGQGSLQY